VPAFKLRLGYHQKLLIAFKQGLAEDNDRRVAEMTPTDILRG
jgi:hypothetical protein